MNRTFRLGSALSLVLICRAQQPPASHGDTAIVHIRVNSDYDDSPASLKMIETLARYVPSVEAQVGPDDNFDSVFVRQYGFGSSPPPKGLPKSYALLRQIILARNNLKSVNDLKRPGVLAVPALPRWAWKDWGRLNLYNYLANMVVFPAASAVPAASSSNREPTSPAVGISESHPSEIAYRLSTAVDTLRLKAPFTVLSFELGIKQAMELVQSKVVPAPDKGIDASQLPVKLAEDNKCDTEPDAKDHPTLIPAQRARISQLMNQFSQRSPVVFILDTGWPRAAYKESFTTLYQILDDVWNRRFGHTYSYFFHGAPPPQNDIDEAGNGHCRCILRSLKELNNLDKDLDPAKRVRVVYVPLTREQGAAGVLTDLILTGILFERQASQHAMITTEIVNESRNLASQQVLDRFPEKWVGDEVQTDKSVLDAILRIGQIYAEVTDTVFFVNESWTVRHPDIDGQYSVKYQNPQYGVVTAAAGNTNGGTNLLDFAQRSAGSADTMAIIDMTASGPAPTSTLLAPNLIDMSLAAGFDGLVTDDIPGTSFAAPRIAWFLAAGEAVRKAPLVLKQWDPALPFVLRNLRDGAATGYGKLLFDPIRYIEFQAGLNAQAPRHTDPPPMD